MGRTRDWLESEFGRGRITFTFDEFRRERALSEAAALSEMSRAQRDHLIASPTRGLYVIVPTEYRADGAPPWPWYLDAMFGVLDASYYAGLLTAAAQHGATAQRAQEVQVVTERTVRNRRIGRQRLVFIRSVRAATAPTDTLRSDVGVVRISTPEMTMLDLVAYPRRSGGWSNIATVVSDLAGVSTPDGWHAALATRPPTAHVQRLGFLLDSAGASGTDVLHAWMTERRRRVVTLVPRSHATGPLDERWRVVGDPGVQPD